MRNVDRTNRVVLLLLGLLLLAAGVYGLLRSFDLLGGDLADRVLLEDPVLDLLRDGQPWTQIAAAVAGVLIALLAAGWLRRQVRADNVIDWLTLRRADDGRTRMRAVAVADALADDLERQPGVVDASVRILTDGASPTVMARVRVDEGGDLDRTREAVHEALDRLEGVLGSDQVHATVRIDLTESPDRSLA